MTPRTDSLDQGGTACGCGRSPTGKCIGWHGLNQEQYEIELGRYREQIYEQKTREE